ncbi:MAG TPA: polyphenol oxidase family protein [Thermoanaerobaculia bacterium]
MWTIEQTSLGRILVPPRLPPEVAVFATTVDFEGRITPLISKRIEAVVQERFGIDATLATCNQVHGASIQRAVKETAWRECDSCDALWSDHRQVALGIKVADCLPITMVDPVHSVIVNVHSGWRGAVQQITANAVDTVAAETSFDARSTFAYLGPSIRACCFETGEEVASRFDDRYVDRSRSRPHVDLIGYTTASLRERGIPAGQIFDSGHCTRCEGSIFHSYRREGKGGGRNLAIVAQ